MRAVEHTRARFWDSASARAFSSAESAKSMRLILRPMYQTIKVDREAQVTWVTLNRPEKKNAMNPQLNADMVDCLTELESDSETRVLVITGAGDSWSAGMDLREYFRALANDRGGQRLVLRRRVHAAGRLRFCHRRRHRSVWPLGSELGHLSGRPGEPRPGADDELPRRPILHAHGQELRRPARAGDRPDQRGGAQGQAARRGDGAGCRPEEAQPIRAARGQRGPQNVLVHGLRAGRGVSAS